MFLTAESPPDEEAVEEEGLEIPYLGAEDVIDEVITLLARLETDRLDTQNRYEHELDTAATLKTKIDELCLRRLKELPVLVQRGKVFGGGGGGWGRGSGEGEGNKKEDRPCFPFLRHQLCVSNLHVT